MERLTHRQHGYPAFVEGDKRLIQMYNRLSAFEDLMDRWGLRDVHEIDRYLRGINAVGGLDHMADIHKATREGRLVILPVVEGTPIYCDGRHFAPHCAGTVHKVENWHYTPVMIEKDFRGETDYVFDIDSFGNEFFLSEDEAQQSMKGEDRAILV